MNLLTKVKRFFVAPPLSISGCSAVDEDRIRVIYNQWPELKRSVEVKVQPIKHQVDSKSMSGVKLDAIATTQLRPFGADARILLDPKVLRSGSWNPFYAKHVNPVDRTSLEAVMHHEFAHVQTLKAVEEKVAGKTQFVQRVDAPQEILDIIREEMSEMSWYSREDLEEALAEAICYYKLTKHARSAKFMTALRHFGIS